MSACENLMMQLVDATSSHTDGSSWVPTMYQNNPEQRYIESPVSARVCPCPKMSPFHRMSTWLRATPCVRAPSCCGTCIPKLHTLQKRSLGTHEAPWVVQAGENHQDLADLAAASISRHGFVIVKDLFNGDELKTLTEPATSKAEEVMGMLRSKRVSLGIGSRAGFREVCLRSPGRYDVPCEFQEFPPQLLERIESIASKALASETQKQGEKGEFESVSRGEHRRAFAGLVRAQPKSEAQIWHADSPHSASHHRAPHLLNVLVPSKAVTEEMGPTELVPGSHLLTNHLMEGASFGTEILYQADTNSPQKIGSSEEPIAATMDAGSVLIFDDRILHRGGHNRAACDRDVAFFSYRTADFFPSTHYESVRTLKTYDHTAMAETVRSEFPGLRTDSKDMPVLADGASGSQVHETLGCLERSWKSFLLPEANRIVTPYASRQSECSREFPTYKTPKSYRSSKSNLVNGFPQERLGSHDESAAFWHGQHRWQLRVQPAGRRGRQQRTQCHGRVPELRHRGDSQQYSADPRRMDELKINWIISKDGWIFHDVFGVWDTITCLDSLNWLLRIAFGPSMTALVYHLSRSFRQLSTCKTFSYIFQEMDICDTKRHQRIKQSPCEIRSWGFSNHVKILYLEQMNIGR